MEVCVTHSAFKFQEWFGLNIHAGVIAVDVSSPLSTSPIREGETVVVIVHGLTGGSHEHYVRSAVRALSKPREEGGLAARLVVINLRGCNQSPVVTPKLYHVHSEHYSSFF